MKKFLLLSFLMVAFTTVFSYAQTVDAPPGVTPGAGSFSYIQHSSFAYSFTQTNTGYQAKTYFTCDPGVTLELGVSVVFIGKNGHPDYSETIQYIPAQSWDVPVVFDFPGFDWNNYEHVLIEWSAWHRDANGRYDDIWDDVAYEYHL